MPVVWWLDARRVAGYDDLLDAREAARYARIRHEPSRVAGRAAAILLRLAVAHRLGVGPDTVVVDRTCPDCPRWHGRPRVRGLEVSVSHAGTLVGAAVGEAGLGLDVEAVAALPDPVDADLAAGVLDDAELARHPRITPAEFGAYWVRKEAVLKPADGVLEAGDGEAR